MKHPEPSLGAHLFDGRDANSINANYYLFRNGIAILLSDELNGRQPDREQQRQNPSQPGTCFAKFHGEDFSQM
jgi:hypothetical protein